VVTDRKKGILKSGAILLTMIGLLTLAGECPAFPYRPSAALSILSEYAALRDSAPRHTQVWKVVPEAGPAGASILRFFPEASAEAGALCVIVIPAPGAGGEIRWEGTGKGGQKKSGAGILLLPGYPAPCDILPVGRGESGAFEEKIEAGGRVFSRSYRVSFAPFSVDEGRERGWIRVEEPGKTGLIMVTVTDEGGRPVVKQLWPADGSWWLYEETPLRRSWLLH
jgi:hypothetical protein